MLLPVVSFAADSIDEAIREALGTADRLPLRTGILHDRVLDLTGLSRFDGTPSAPRGNLALFRQAAYELSRASRGALRLPEAQTFASRAAGSAVIPIRVLDVAYERVRPEAGAAIGRGEVPPDALEEARAFLAAPAIEHTYRGARTSFVIEPDDVSGNDALPVTRIEIDPGDGGGFRSAGFGEPVEARYGATGEVIVRVRVTRGGVAREASFAFDVRALAAPLPDDTLFVTASEAWLGQFGTGRAYVRYGQGHTSVVNPVVVIEGFDLDNSMSWDELYALLNQEGLADTIQARGYDAIVLDFDEATNPIEENGLLTAELIRQVRAMLAPGARMSVVGASMGGLCSRYALAHLEQLGEPLPTKTWISFDTPHLGANIPLGIQYWMQFFASQSADAAFLLSRLDTPAAREMLVYHYTTPASSSPSADPQRPAFLANLAAAGDWPTRIRRVAVANGSGTGTGQGFGLGAQIIRWEYNNLLVTILGNIWALPDNTPTTTIFNGRIRILFVSDTQKSVPVSGTLPYDGAPGGRRATMTQMDTTAAPYGDIVALHPAHCFIPTPSAIALSTVGLSTPLIGNPSVPSGTPFAAVYLPTANEDHVAITPGNAAFVLGEIEQPVVAAPDPMPTPGVALRSWPQPSRGASTIAFSLPTEGRVKLSVVDVAGRTVQVLQDGVLTAGEHRVPWSGVGESGRQMAAGIYFITLETGAFTQSVRAAVLK